MHLYEERYLERRGVYEVLRIEVWKLICPISASSMQVRNMQWMAPFEARLEAKNCSRF